MAEIVPIPELPGHVPFVKMEGCANDYIFVDNTQKKFPLDFSKKEIRQIVDRHQGIGGDGLVLIEASQRAQLRMRMWNADATPSRMCGNALRCLALWEHQRSHSTEFLIESQAGLHTVKIPANQKEPQIEVEMGRPIFDERAIPFMRDAAKKVVGMEPIFAKLEVPSFGEINIYSLSMGNPHCVLFVEKMDTKLVHELGVALESHPAFPERTNIAFVLKKADGLFLRTFERGSGETKACGSGACAAHVVSVLAKESPSLQKVSLLGGELEVKWTDKNSSVWMRGPARIVYKGSFLRSSLE